MAIPKVFHRAPGNYDPDVASNEAGLACQDPSLTVQSDANDADINTIVRNFGITGRMPENPRVPQYADFDVGVTDYKSALDAVRAADAAFMELPAETRAFFDNDPQRLLEFVSDPLKVDEARKMGLPSVAPVPEPVVEPPAPV